MRWAVIGKNRCTRHGGRSTGPKTPFTPKDNEKRGLSHGIYAQVAPAKELERIEKIPTGTIDEELKLAKWRLSRCYMAQRQWEEQKAALEAGKDPRLPLESVEETTTQGMGAEGNTFGSMTRKFIRKKTDFSGKIVTFSRLVAHLENQRAELLAQDKGAEFVDSVAERLRAFDEAAGNTIPPTPDKTDDSGEAQVKEADA